MSAEIRKRLGKKCPKCGSTETNACYEAYWSWDIFNGEFGCANCGKVYFVSYSRKQAEKARAELEKAAA